MIQIDIAHHKLSNLAKDTPALRCQHLLDLQKDVDNWGDSTRSGIILEILIREQEQKNGIELIRQLAHCGNPLSIHHAIQP
jgi:hypothetical protein